MLRRFIAAALALALAQAATRALADERYAYAASPPAASHEPSGGLRGLVTRAAVEAGVPVAIAHAVIAVESGYQPRARSPKGALGIGQVLCPTARGLGHRGSCSDLYDPRVNLRFAMRYLRLALDRGGVGCAGVSLYERGIHARPVCSKYGRAVMMRARR